MRMSIRFVLLITALLLTSPAWALGERPDGYVGVVKPGGDAAEIAKLINNARRDEYQRLATENGIKVRDVEAIAGKKALERTQPGQYILINGVWMPK